MKAFSILKKQTDTRMEGNSESDSSDSSNEENIPIYGQDEAAKKILGRNVEKSGNSVANIDKIDGEGKFDQDSQIEERGSSSRVEASHENGIDDKKISDDEEKKESVVDGYCSPCRDRRNDDEKINNYALDSNSDSSSDDDIFESYQRYKRQSQKRRSSERSEEKESSDVQSTSPNLTSSNSLSEEDDSDMEFRASRQHEVLGKRCYAHKVRREALSGFMKTKIGELPLPLPLRLYVNYNREL